MTFEADGTLHIYVSGHCLHLKESTCVILKMTLMCDLVEAHSWYIQTGNSMRTAAASNKGKW